MRGFGLSIRIIVLGLAFVGPALPQVYNLSDLNTEQIHSLDHSRTVIVIPGGILEEHGPHLPAYADGIYAEAYSREFAHAIVTRPGWTVLLFPQIPLGVGGANSLGGKDISPGSYSVQMATLRAVYMDLALTLGEQRFQ